MNTGADDKKLVNLFSLAMRPNKPCYQQLNQVLDMFCPIISMLEHFFDQTLIVFFSHKKDNIWLQPTGINVHYYFWLTLMVRIRNWNIRGFIKGTCQEFQ